MADDLDGSPGQPAMAGALLRIVDGIRSDVREDVGHLRDDVREDNDRLERRMMALLEDVRGDLHAFQEAHSKEHLAGEIATESEFGKVRDFIRNAELHAARRDGALGVFRFAVELLGRHAKPIGFVLLSAAGFIGVLAGNIRIEVIGN
jgi:hypothetical protein